MAFWPTKYDDSRRRRTPPVPSQALVRTPAETPTSSTPGTPVGSPPRGVAEARTALRLAQLLRGTITPLRGDTVLELLEPHRPRLVPKPVNPLPAMAGKPQGQMLDALLRPVGQIVTDVLLPGVRDHLIDRLVAGRTDHEESLPGAVDLAEAMRALVGRMRGAGKGHLQAVIAAIEADARATADTLTRDTRPIDVGGIDRLARALLRFEVRRMALEALGGASALQEVVYQSRRLARYSLRRATEAIEGFVADRGLKTLHASLATLAQADGLIVIALRNLDDQEETKEESGPFVEPADRKAMNDWLSAAWRLSDTLFDLVGKAAAGGELDDLLFAALLRQLRSLHHFCADLTHAGRPATLDTLKQRLVERTEALAKLTGERLIETMLRRPTDAASARRLLGRGQSLAQLLHDMGLDGELEELAMHLVMARDALAHNG
ncbi:hypothetical protein J2848_000205 [Azospirillum lipoferum]|uniref:Uncharacterized protein n=1 Tax=Azospirillum lipoferum TaxID=193 RepID=A0A5A9GRK1_AZOLI|nr:MULTISPECIES: hypothetical protein [Azospirillum]KAA0597078.1 hypothetical protein FZ942_08185 [Azospirillum lipoferum]MCP1608569.1 hypothetical protein [Azospirillum lipoferum]MDW5536113.1 hypothetical protein [Azospirillum sp. NL1]